MMKIYTKTGDSGMTSLVGGQRVKKCCERLESYGTVDELNSFIGLLITKCMNDQDKAFLQKVQNTLFVVGGNLAGSNTTAVTPDMITAVEQEIDRLQEMVPPLKAFVLPGGSEAASVAHVCRTVCRRAERAILRLVEIGEAVDESVMKYVNRLSDYFFVLSRKLNKDAGVGDVEWKA